MSRRRASGGRTNLGRLQEISPDRKSYYKGLHDGLGRALSEAKSKAEHSYASDQQQAYGLILVDQKAPGCIKNIHGCVCYLCSPG